MTEQETRLVCGAALAMLKSMTVDSAQRRVEELLKQVPYIDSLRLERYGFKVHSQNDEDGIIQEIFRRIGTTNRTFFEFGCGNGLESNCCYLLLQGWRGAWIDAEDQYLAHARERFAVEIADGRLTVERGVVTAESINKVATALKLPAEIDLLSIDVDGNDYYIFEALEALRPRVAIIEYNASLYPPVKMVQKHEPLRRWDSTSYSGASLCALAELARKKGYTLVGTNLPGVNAFFVRTDLAVGKFPEASAAALFNPPRFDLGVHGYPTGHPPGTGPYVVLP